MNARRASQGTRVRHNGEQSPEQLEEELNHTRSEISQTLAAIEQWLSPEQMLDQILRRWRGGPGEFASNLGESVKQNPVAAALVATGLAWLMTSGKPGVPSSARSGDREPPTTAHEAKERLTSMASKTRGREASLISQASDHAHDAGKSLLHQGERARQFYGHVMREQPLVIGALGLAVGALLGAGLVDSRTEKKPAGTGRSKPSTPDHSIPPIVDNPSEQGFAREFRQTSEQSEADIEHGHSESGC